MAPPPRSNSYGRRNISTITNVWYSKCHLRWRLRALACRVPSPGLADGVGFEPTRPVRVCRFSRPVPSTARPPIQVPAAVRPGRLEIIALAPNLDRYSLKLQVLLLL